MGPMEVPMLWLSHAMLLWCDGHDKKHFLMFMYVHIHGEGITYLVKTMLSGEEYFYHLSIKVRCLSLFACDI